jgi:AraC family transcriptional regulator of adaptative response/methylated-DNA-[protein]-cysteine methyltransferase
MGRDAESAEAASTDQRWATVLARKVDATFVYSVSSTGVYCRPSCPSRRPLRKNVAFHETPLAAELAGFRPCKRCQPRDSAAKSLREAARPVVAMCRLLEEDSGATTSLRALAEHVGLSESHAHRLFTEATGLTPKRYREAVVRARVHEELKSSGNVTEAIYAAGFSAPSRFYEHVSRMLGMPPRQYRAGAPGASIRFAVGECALGSVLVAATNRGVCAVFLGDDPDALLHDLERQFPRAELVGADEAFEGTVARVVGLVESRSGVATEGLPLDIRGTAFQERVWRALQAIPRGETATYAEIAAAIGAPSASRAVARACADNRIAVLIPCHRVVRTDGKLSGYRWGVERKDELLRRERTGGFEDAR